MPAWFPRERVQIAFTYAALNDLDVLTGDIGNAYLQNPSTEKKYTILTDDFGPEYQGCIALAICAAYGLKSAGADFAITCVIACLT